MTRVRASAIATMSAAALGAVALIGVPAVTSAAPVADPCAVPASQARGVVQGANDGVNLTDDQAAALENDLRTRLALKAITSNQGIVRQGTITQSALANGSVTIPVYVHVIRRDTSTAGGNVSDSAIASQVSALNAAHSNARSPFRFRLAATDRTTNATWFTATQGSSAEAAMERALHRGDGKALNLYTLQVGGGNLGWSSVPANYDVNRLADGVEILHTTLPGGSYSGYNSGDTAVHEVGHWLGLLHVFQGGCSGSGDYVADTPAQAYAQYACGGSPDTCSAAGRDPVNNFMGYTTDACMTQFTAGQVTRMSDSWVAYRA